MILYDARASAILDRLVRSQRDSRPILVPANICDVVPRVLREANRAFELMDIDPESMEMARGGCTEAVARRRCGGILFVRPYGRTRDVGDWFLTLRRLDPDLLIIDDQCLCPPEPARRTPTPGSDVTLFSTGYAKFVDLGYGGFAVAREGIAAELPLESSAEWLGNRGTLPVWSQYVKDVQTARDTVSAHKDGLNAIYSSIIPEEAQFSSEFQSWRFNIRVEQPEILLAELRNAGLFASRHYTAGSQFTHAALLAERVVNLFNDFRCTPSDAKLAARIVADHVLRTR